MINKRLEFTDYFFFHIHPISLTPYLDKFVYTYNIDLWTYLNNWYFINTLKSLHFVQVIITCDDQLVTKNNNIFHKIVRSINCESHGVQYTAFKRSYVVCTVPTMNLTFANQVRRYAPIQITTIIVAHVYRTNLRSATQLQPCIK